jgi:hypothetical protein
MQTVEDILTDLGVKNLQDLWFKYREVNGERVLEPANGANWWQITTVCPDSHSYFTRRVVGEYESLL